MTYTTASSSPVVPKGLEELSAPQTFNGGTESCDQKRVRRTLPPQMARCMLLAAALVAFIEVMTTQTASWYSIDLLTSLPTAYVGQLVLVAVCAVFAYRRQSFTPWVWAFVGLSGALALAPVVLNSKTPMVFHTWMYLLCTAVTYALICGAPMREVFTIRGVFLSWGRSLVSLVNSIALLSFAFVFEPRERKVAHNDEELASRSRVALSVGLGLVAAAAVLLITVPLLMESDPVFASTIKYYLRDLWRGLNFRLANDFVYGVIRFLILMPLSFSLIVNASEGSYWRREPHKPASIHAAGPSTMLVILNVVYAAFAYSQISQLVWGVHSDTLASYVHQSFTQLVVVAALNFIVMLVVLRGTRGTSQNRMLVVLELIFIALTACMIGVCATRTVHYVVEFGLTPRRVLVIWAMVAIAVMLIACAVASIYKECSVIKICVICWMGLWVALWCIRPDALVAEYNVNAYLAGTLEDPDIDMMSDLSTDAIPALQRLQAHTSDAVLQTRIDYVIRTIAGDQLFDSSGY